MAVQQNKKSPSRRGMRRAQLRPAAASEISTDKVNGDRHVRHHVSGNGYYRGREVIAQPAEEEAAAE